MTIRVGQKAELTSVNHDHIITSGARIAVDPANDFWMRGIRYGTVTKVGRKYVHIYCEVFNRAVRVPLADCTVIE